MSQNEDTITSLSLFSFTCDLPITKLYTHLSILIDSSFSRYTFLWHISVCLCDNTKLWCIENEYWDRLQLANLKIGYVINLFVIVLIGWEESVWEIQIARYSHTYSIISNRLYLSDEFISLCLYFSCSFISLHRDLIFN